MEELGNELAGLLVVSLEQAVAAPYCGLLLADAGARVIKVERPDGDFARSYDAGADGQSAIFAWLNRGKESVCLDLKDSRDLELMRAMLRKADVFLSNLAPGAVTRLGLSGEALRKDNAELICVTLSGYGEDGNAATKKAYDFLVQGEAGVCSVTGTPDHPARVGVSITDLSTGLTAYSAVLRALIKRGITKRGLDIKLSMFDVVADWMNMPLLQHRYAGGAPERSGLQHSFVAPYGAFQCRDGKFILLSIQNNREFSVFCEHILNKSSLASDPRFIQNPKRYANRAALDEIINAVFAGIDQDALTLALDRVQIANAKLNDVADLSKHPFLKNSVAQIGATRVEMAALPIKSAGDGMVLVPALGTHTNDIREEFME